MEYEIIDMRKGLLEVYDQQNSLEGVDRRIISDAIMSTDFNNGLDHKFLAQLRFPDRFIRKPSRGGST